MKAIVHSIVVAAVTTLLSVSLPLHAQPTGKDAGGHRLSDAAAKLLGVDPLNPDEPLLAPDTIISRGASANIKILKVLVEDNYDMAKRKSAPDHLEVQFQNVSAKPLQEFEIHYKIVDDVTGKVEAYYKKLTGFSVLPGDEGRIHIDTGGQPGHFRANPNSSYYTSPNAKTMTVKLVAKDSALVTATVKKDKGGAEKAD